MNTKYGLAAVAVLTLWSLAQSPTGGVRPFAARDYPAAKYQVTQSSHALGDVTIRVVHAKKRKPDGSAPSYCRAWVEVSKDKKLLRRIHYSDFEPVGFSYGVFVPSKQPSADYFVLVKEGDYDGHLLLVDREGKVTDLLGGFYFLTTDKRFLVSEYSSDSSGLAVFDMQAHRLLFQSTDVPYVQEWYKERSGYFFTESVWSNGESVPHEGRDAIYRLDLRARKFVKSSIDPKVFQSATRIAFDFDPRQSEDCTSH